MQLVLGTVLYDNSAEVMDDDSLLGKESYSFMGLQAAIAEGQKRLKQNSGIKQINIYEIFDGVRRSSPQGRYGLVYKLLPDSAPRENSN